MPQVLVPTEGIFPTIGQVMDGARARVNDMINATEGDILTNDAPASQTYLTNAWNWYQNKCDVNGVELGIGDDMLFGVPARFSQDTAFPMSISQFGCSDGVNQYEQPVLPANIISPRFVWRRFSVPYGSNGNDFTLMRQADAGLPTWLDPNVYDWRKNAIYFYGDTQAQDIRIRSSTYLPPLNILSPTDPVSMMGSQDCLSARVAFEYASARGAAQAPAMQQWADDAFSDVASRTGRRKQAKVIRRQGWSGGNRGWVNRWPVPR